MNVAAIVVDIALGDYTVSLGVLLSLLNGESTAGAFEGIASVSQRKRQRSQVEHVTTKLVSFLRFSCIECGGGAEQDPILPGRTHIKVPDGYPLDQYWNGESPKEDYNYLHVEVVPGKPTKFTINRFRPWSAEPFATVELFK
jgi:hypothetical protein